MGHKLEHSGQSGTDHRLASFKESFKGPAGFILQPGGRYRHDFGSGGGFAVKSGVVEFTGGPLDGQAGKLDKGMIRLYNQSRSAMITDCEPT